VAGFKVITEAFVGENCIPSTQRRAAICRSHHSENPTFDGGNVTLLRRQRRIEKLSREPLWSARIAAMCSGGISSELFNAQSLLTLPPKNVPLSELF
jgi:hypothetical protein